MKTETARKPQLKNLDELFLLRDETKVPAISAVQGRQTETDSRRIQSTLAITDLSPFKGHPFRLYDGERLDDMVDSIKKNGVLVPIIARISGDDLEILSGHNRVHAAGLAGLKRVPAIVLEKISDAEAWIYVVETNLMQRSFADMSHSEKAAVIATQHGKLFSQGKRNDILNRLRLLESPDKTAENETPRQLGDRYHSDALVGTMYSLSSRAVSRYIRINQLIPALKTKLDTGEIPFIPAVDLSFLKAAEQNLLDRCISLNGFKVDMKKANLLRQYSESGKMDEDKIYLILSGETKTAGKKRNSYSFKIKPKVYKKYFTEQLKPTEVEVIIEKALEMYFEAQDQ